MMMVTMMTIRDRSIATAEPLHRQGMHRGDTSLDDEADSDTSLTSVGFVGAPTSGKRDPLFLLAFLVAIPPAGENAL